MPPRRLRATRRQALKAGAGALVASGFAGTVSASTDASCVIIYDDSPTHDYTKTFPVHQEEDAPGCLGCVSDYVRTRGALSPDQLLEMADAGFEILSHTAHHHPVGSVGLASDIAPGDTELEATFGVHARFAGAPLHVSDDTGASFTATIAPRTDDQPSDVVRLDAPADTGVRAAENARVRLADEFLHASLTESKDVLEGYGVDVNHFIAPYQIYDEHAATLVADHYDSVGNGVLGQGLNGRPDPYWLNRATVAEQTKSSVRRLARRAAEDDELLLLGSHSWDERLTQDQIRMVIRAVRAEGLAVQTLDEALHDHGILDRRPDPADGASATRSSTVAETTQSSTTDPMPPSTPGNLSAEGSTPTAVQTPTATPEQRPEATSNPSRAPWTLDAGNPLSTGLDWADEVVTSAVRSARLLFG